MHDPSTVAFDFRLGPKSKLSGYRPSFLTIWHEDPETDGSDDSCGYSYPKAGPADENVIADFARELESDYDRRPAPEPGSGDFTITLWLYLERVAFLDGKSLSVRHLKAFLRSESYPGSIWVGGSFDYEDKKRFAWIVWRIYAQLTRPWYRHPKWHLHHWRIQFHPWQQLRRRLFTRCMHCGEPFRRGEAVISGQWHPKRPGWFQSEENVYHNRCRTDLKSAPSPSPGSPS